MSDPIYPQQLVAHFDEDGIELVAGSPGPAGAAELELSNGVSLLIDFADSSSMTSLRVEGGAIPELLADLIGEERAERLESADRNPAAKPMRLPREQAGGDEEQPRFRGSQPLSPRQVAQELGVLSRLRSLSDDEEVHDVVRATSALEFEQTLRRFNEEMPGLVRSNPQTAAVAAELLNGEELSLDQVIRSNPKAAAQLAGLLRRYQSEDESLRRAYEFLVDPFSEGIRDFDVSGGIAHVASAPSGDRALVDFDFEAPIRISAASVSTGGLLRARVSAFEENWWLRVTLEGSQVLLAVVPVIEHGDRAIAEAILPPDVSMGEIELHLTQAPLPEATSSIDRVINAIDLGRRAVRLSMAGQLIHPGEIWMQCADAWEQLGDERRAKLARTYSTRGLRGAGPDLVTAEILEVFESAS